MKRGQVYSSGWLKAKDMLDQNLPNGMDLTIKGAKEGSLDDGSRQVVLSFHEDERELGLNATNFDTICDIFKVDDSDYFAGKKINAFPHKLDRPYNGATHGIRVRLPIGVVAPVAKGAPPPSIPSSPPSPASPPANVVKNKNWAWAEWVKAAPGGTPNVPAWQSAVISVGKPEGTFTESDWEQVATLAALPF